VRFDAIAFTAESLLLVGRAAVVVFCLASLEPSLLLTCKLLVELQYIVESAETTIFENTNLRKNVLPPLDQQRGPALDDPDEQKVVSPVHSDEADLPDGCCEVELAQSDKNGTHLGEES
jgi:hypothetical protein